MHLYHQRGWRISDEVVPGVTEDTSRIRNHRLTVEHKASILSTLNHTKPYKPRKPPTEPLKEALKGGTLKETLTGNSTEPLKDH